MSLTTAAAAASPKPMAPPPAKVRVDLTDQRELRSRWSVIGRLHEVRRSVVASEVEGKIISMEVEAGDAVTAGETVLARIDQVWGRNALVRAEAALTEAKANLAQSQAQVVKSRSDFDKLDELLKLNATQPREYEQAKALYDADVARVAAAEAGIRVAEADRDLAQYEVDRLVITAPFDGTVVNKMIEVGEWADKGAPVAEIVSRGSIDAVIDVPERLINHLRIQDSIEVFIEALGLHRRGAITQIVPMGETASRTFPVKIRLDDQQGELKAGMSVVASIPTSRKITAVTIPRDALIRTPGESFVWLAVMVKNGSPPIAVKAPVKVLFGHEDRYVVEDLHTSTKTLAAEMAVVIEGGQSILFPGQPLMILNTPPAQASKPTSSL